MYLTVVTFKMKGSNRGAKHQRVYQVQVLLVWCLSRVQYAPSQNPNNFSIYLERDRNRKTKERFLYYFSMIRVLSTPQRQRSAPGADSTGETKERGNSAQNRQLDLRETVL